MAYLNSGDISVFPSVKRGDTYQKDSRLLTEESMTRPLKIMWANESFVISTKDEINNGSLEFVIGGYYVNVPDTSSLRTTLAPSSAGTVYAILTTSNTNGYIEISGEDVGGKYQGIEFEFVVTGGSEPTPGVGQTVLGLFEVNNAFQCTKALNPSSIDGDKNKITFRSGNGTTGIVVDKGEAYLDTEEPALYIGTDDGQDTSSALKLDGNGGGVIGDVIDCEQINISRDSSHLPQINVKAGNDTSIFTVQGDANNKVSVDAKGTIMGETIIGGSASFNTTIDSTGVHCNNTNSTSNLNGTLTVGNSAFITTIGNGAISTIGNIASTMGNISASGTTTSGGKLTVSSGGAAITGNTKITGNLEITGTTTATGAINANGGVTIPSGKTLTNNGTTTLAGTTNLNGTTNFNGTFNVSNGLSVTGQVTATGGFFSNGLIAPMFSTTIPSDFNNAINGPRTYGGYFVAPPTHAPLGATDGFILLEVFRNDTYVLQRCTEIGGANMSILKIYHRVGHSVGTIWSFTAWVEI